MRTTTVALLAALALAPQLARAQSFNVDFNVGLAGPWTGAPASTYTAGADSGGFWNAVPVSTIATNLTDAEGQATNVDLTISHIEAGYFTDIPGCLGDVDKLFGDGCSSEVGQAMTVSITGLRNGTYSVYTYAPDPVSGDFNHVDVPGSPEGDLIIISNLAGCTPVHTFNFVIHHIVVQTGTIQIVLSDAGDIARIAGFQLRYHGGTSARLYVDDSAPGNDGSSWGRAVKRLDDAMTAAKYNNTTNEIWVARGTYKPTAGTERHLSFEMQNGLAIYGGFAGTETAISQRDLPTNPSFLSGNIGAREADDNSYHVITAAGISSSAIFDGFIILGGRADGSGTDAGGGAVWIDNANPRFRNCTFHDNFALEGGAVSFRAATSLARFSNCTFYNNEAQTFGGAVYFRGASGSQVAFGNCIFRGNTAGGYGGAVYSLNGPGWNEYANCVFSGNHSTNLSGGAIYSLGSQNDTRLDHCTVSMNTAASGGGLVANGGSMTIDNSVVWWNSDSDGATNQFQENLSGAATPVVNFSNVRGLPNNYAGRGPGCLNTNPFLSDPDGADNIAGTADDDLHMLVFSPCIDAADNARIPVDYADIDIDNNLGETIPIDIEGNPRRFDHPIAPDTGLGSAPIADMGAYEIVYVPSCPADFNEDGFVDFFDFDAFVDCFEGIACPPGKTADFNNDNFVDFFDFDEFSHAFEAGC